MFVSIGSSCILFVSLSLSVQTCCANVFPVFKPFICRFSSYCFSCLPPSFLPFLPSCPSYGLSEPIRCQRYSIDLCRDQQCQYTGNPHEQPSCRRWEWEYCSFTHLILRWFLFCQHRASGPRIWAHQGHGGCASG